MSDDRTESLRDAERRLQAAQLASDVDALDALLDDPGRRERMGRAGRERALAEFSWRAVAEATVAAYQHAIDEKRGTGC